MVFLFLLLLFKGKLFQEVISLKNEDEININFFSCANFQFKNDSNVFDSVLKEKADLLVWIGDFCYSDAGLGINYDFLKNKPTIIERFESTYYHPSYKKLRESNVAIKGIWDGIRS